MVFLLEDDPTRDVEHENQQSHDERRAPAGGVLLLERGVRRVFSDEHGQIRGRTGEVVFRPCVAPQRGEEQRRRLARDPGDREQNPGDETAARAAADDPQRSARPAASERKRRLPQRIRNHEQHVLSRPQHNREHQKRERDRSGKSGESPHRMTSTA